MVYKTKSLTLVPAIIAAAFWTSPLAKAEPTGQLEILVRDAEGGPVACRIHLKDRRGHAQKAEGHPFWHDHLVCSGHVSMSLAPGAYDYAIERGPEYRRKSGQIDIVPETIRKLDVELERIANLRATGWYSGDLHVHRPVSEIEQLMLAEDLDVAPVITWWNNRNLWKDKELPQITTRRFDGHRLYTVMAGEDEREGGALLYFGLQSPLAIETNNRELPSPMQFVGDARKRHPAVWIDIEKPFWWDVPAWLASGQMNSIGVANNHMCRDKMYPSEAWGKPRDTERLPEPRDNGYWSQEIYYHMLNSGLRLPPSAGSASGVLPNPVGYNRVYVHLDEPLTYGAWFGGLSRGRSFLTNGPLLLVTEDGLDPGTVIKLPAGEKRVVRLNIQLTSQDPISQIEMIQNGNVFHKIPCSNELTQQHSFDLVVDQPGWFLVRAIADIDNTFRFASTAPWFVEVGDVNHRISRKSAQFFLDWVTERMERIQAKIDNETERGEVLVWHVKAREFWTERVKLANSE